MDIPLLSVHCPRRTNDVSQTDGARTYCHHTVSVICYPVVPPAVSCSPPQTCPYPSIHPPSLYPNCTVTDLPKIPNLTLLSPTPHRPTQLATPSSSPSSPRWSRWSRWSRWTRLALCLVSATDRQAAKHCAGPDPPQRENSSHDRGLRSVRRLARARGERRARG